MRISDWSSDVCSSDLHRLVGELAQRHLTPAADAEVARLLAGEKDPTLAGVAAWADTLRNEDPPRFKATSKWHYVNTAPDGGCRYVPARDCPDGNCVVGAIEKRSEEHTSELQSLMRISYAVFCLKKKNNTKTVKQHIMHHS